MEAANQTFMLVHSYASCAPVESGSTLSLPDETPLPFPEQLFSLQKRPNLKLNQNFCRHQRILI